MGNPVSCDVGIVNYGNFQGLGRCLESLFSVETPLPGRVFVVENGPNDIPAELSARFPSVRFHKNRQNLGFARGCNQIIEGSRAPFICFLNPDTILDRPFIARGAKWLQDHRDVAVLGPKIIDPDGRVQGSARGFPTLATAFFGRTSILTRLFPHNSLARRNIKTLAAGDGPQEVDWVSGACMIVRRQAIDEVGGLDEGFFMYWEDCDWCTRFRQRGWKVVYHPGIGPVIHEAGSCSKNVRLRSLYWFHKSAARLYLKYDTSPLRLGSALAIGGSLLRFLLFLPKTLLPSR